MLAVLGLQLWGLRMTDFAAELKSLINKGGDLPALPDTILELRAALDDERVGDMQIADIIGRDPVITGKLLRVANSVAYSRGVEVNSVLNAVQRVGMREVRVICVVLAVVDAFPGTKNSLDLKQFWDHSAAVGRVAQLLCRKIQLQGAAGTDDVYVGGLLHDVGILLMSQFFPDQFGEIQALRAETGVPLWKAEKQVIGMCHGQVGGLLTERWSLPASISTCISGHHVPEEVPAEYVHACQVLRASESLCTSLGAGVDAEGEADDDAFNALSALDMPDAQMEAVLGEIEEVGVSMRGIFA
jgi:HD-like signal output (HDOD) protein